MKRLVCFTLLLEAVYGIFFKAIAGPTFLAFSGHASATRFFGQLFAVFSIFMACLALMEILGHRIMSVRILYIALAYSLILLCCSLEAPFNAPAASDSLFILSLCSFLSLFVLAPYWAVKEECRREREETNRKQSIASSIDIDSENPLQGINNIHYIGIY